MLDRGAEEDVATRPFAGDNHLPVAGTELKR